MGQHTFREMNKLALLFLLMLSIQIHAQTLVKHDIIQGKSSANAHNLYPTSDKIYFYGFDKDSNYHLHSIDTSGSVKRESDSTRRYRIYVKQYNTSYYRSIIKIADTIYFTADNSAMNGAPFWDQYMFDKLFALYPDGSSAKPIEQPTGEDVSLPAFYTELGGKLYFMGKRYYEKNDLYEYDPSTRKLRKLTKYLWQQSQEIHAYMDVFAYNERIYFSGRDSSTHMEVFTYDPHLDSVWLLADIAPGFTSSIPGSWVVYNNNLYFNAYVDKQNILFEYNDVTDKITAIDTINGSWYQVSEGKSRLPVILKGAIYFPYKDNTTNEYVIGRFDSVSKKITPVPIPRYNGYVSELAVYNDNIYMASSAAKFTWPVDSVKLMMYDGDTTFKVLYDTLSAPRDLTAFNNNLYFTARSNSEYSWELYHYNDSLVKVNPPTTIANATSQINAVLHPNPAKNTAHLQFELQVSETISISLTDINGREVYNSDCKLYSASKHTVDIPLSNLPAGNYIYSVSTSDNKLLATGKLVKQ